MYIEKPLCIRYPEARTTTPPLDPAPGTLQSKSFVLVNVVQGRGHSNPTLSGNRGNNDVTFVLVITTTTTTVFLSFRTGGRWDMVYGRDRYVSPFPVRKNKLGPRHTYPSRPRTCVLSAVIYRDLTITRVSVTSAVKPRYYGHRTMVYSRLGFGNR